MAVKYLPLQLMDYEDEIIAKFGTDRERLEKHGFPKTKDDSEYIDLMLKLFCGMIDEDKSTQMFLSIFECYSDIMIRFGMADTSSIKSMLCDTYDICVRPTIYQIWKKNKQVYKPDKDFIKALVKTENLKITKDIFSRQPCKHFYVDVADCDIFEPIKGFFVNIFEIEGKILLIIYAVNEEAWWSTYDTMHLDIFENGEMTIEDISKINPSGTYSYNPFDILLSGKTPINNSTGLNANESKFFIYQLLTYLTSHEPQFEESPITKSTYRQPKQGAPIKNKFSEIQQFDIGVRFGKSFREQKRKYKCDTILTKHLESKRKSPIPHFRSAHWQGYWVGRGRTEHIVKWIEPTFVNGETSNDVVIHRV